MSSCCRKEKYFICRNTILADTYSVFTVLDRTLPLFPMIWGLSVVSTYAVIPAENLCSLSALLAFLSDSARNDMITCNLIRIIPGILECKFNQNLHFISFFI